MHKELTEKARQLGFIKTGFTTPTTPPHFNEFKSWLTARKYGEMSWFERNIEIRKDPSLLLPGCRTIISMAFPYPHIIPGTPDGLNVARFTQPNQTDYHMRLRDISSNLVKLIKENFKESKTRICIDSAPILERSIAYSAGIGFFGKNNMLIIPGFGSFFFLVEIFTTVEIDFPEPQPVQTACGSCELCLKACPSGALEKPFFLNASKCLSYLTIEQKGPVSKDNSNMTLDCFLGCDRCQEACPYNKERKEREIILPSGKEFSSMDEETFKTRFGNTSFARAGLGKIKSNIKMILDK